MGNNIIIVVILSSFLFLSNNKQPEKKFIIDDNLFKRELNKELEDFAKDANINPDSIYNPFKNYK